MANKVPSLVNIVSAGSNWRHTKSGRVYTVVTNAALESNGQEMVVYSNNARVWVRPKTEFIEKFDEL